MKSFYIDDWIINPAEGVLTRGDEIVRLEPRVMDVLVYFASRPGEVISRGELERDVWHGALVGYDAVSATIIKLRKAFNDNAKEPRFIATVPKKGYQLVASVHDGEKIVGESQKITVTQNQYIKPQLWIISFASVVVVTIFLVLTWHGVEQPVQHTKPASLIVLPFENIGELDEHDIFVDGVTEDIITDLSRLSKLSVMSSNVTFKYRGQQITPKELNKTFSVDYVVKGNARRYGENIRINIQLVNAATGFNVWAHRYDRKLDDVFSVQDDITTKLIENLSLKLTSTEKQHLAQRSTNNLHAYDYFLEGQRISKMGTKQSYHLAAEAYRKAIDKDPTYGRAYGALAFILAMEYRRGWTDAPSETIDRALVLAEKGVALDESIPQTHWVMGFVHLMRKEYEKAQQAVANAIDIMPNYADGYGLLALINNNLGKPHKAIEYAEKGMEINPYYTWDYLFNIGRAHYTLGKHAMAIEVLEKAQARNENAVPVKLFLAASYVQTGQIEDAEWVIEQLRVLNPVTTITHTDKAISIANLNIKTQLLNDLRKAGLPEQ